MSFPILYDKRAQSFDNMGLGALSDCLKCNVTREINGEYELTMDYPVEGVHFNEIELESIIAAKVPDKENMQLFKVYSISEPIDLTVTIDCEHVSYMTGDIPLKPFTSQGPMSVDNILAALCPNGEAIPEGITSPFIFTDELQPDTTVFTLTEPASMREVIGNEEGMLLDLENFKDCEWDIDNFNFILKYSLGTDKSDSIQYVYGKNVSDLSQDQNLTNTVTGIYPYVHAETDDGMPINVIGSICYGEGHTNFAHERIVPTNVENYFTDEEKEAWRKNSYGIKMPTEEEVTAKAEEAIKDFDFVCVPEVNVTVSPVDLSGVSGYEHVAENLKRVQLGDTITVIFDVYGINKKARVVKTVYDVLNECNDSVEVGDPSPNLAATLAEIGEKTEVNRAGIIIGKDSILAYVNKTTGEMGSQFKMTEDEIKSTVASYGGYWNMVPLTGSRDVGGEAWTIQLYNYGDPNVVYKNSREYAGQNYFDETSGYVWECDDNGHWTRKKFTREHTFIDYPWVTNPITGVDELTKTIVPAGMPSYTLRMDSYCESNIIQNSDRITAEVSRAGDREQAIFDMVPGQILMEVSSPSDGDRRASIKLTTVNKDGSRHDQGTGYIVFTGTCIFNSDLETSGATVINGNNIKTGKIHGDYIDVNTLNAKRITTNNNGDGYYQTLQNGVFRTYDQYGEQRSSTTMYYLPIRVSDTFNITYGFRFYYGICINDTSGNGFTLYLFGPDSSIMRVRRSDGNLIPPASVVLQGIEAVCDWLELRIFTGMSYQDIHDTDPSEPTTLNTRQIKAIFNNPGKRIQFKNANVDTTDPDKMAATVQYVKDYVDDGNGSDRRWKNSVTDLEDVSSKYMGLRPVSFKYNDGVDVQNRDEEIRFGLIAQEVGEIYPESIYHIVNHIIPDADDVTPGIGRYTPCEYYKLRYEELHALHISMIQKHEKEIQELKEQIKLLQNKED